MEQNSLCATCGQEVPPEEIFNEHIDYETEVIWNDNEEYSMAIFTLGDVSANDSLSPYCPWNSAGGYPVLLNRDAARKLRDFINNRLNEDTNNE